MNPKILKKKRILVVGLARSGLAAGELLLSLGSIPVLTDTRTQVDGLQTLADRGAEVHLGTAAETLADGCYAVVVSPAVPPDAPVIRRADQLGIPVWAELELAARFLAGTQIAITGTNGKTTTASLVGEILKNTSKNAHVAGNIGLALSSIALQTRAEDITVIEVSSFQLEHIDQFHPHGAALLNLTPDHLNRHGGMEAYGALKEGMLRNMTADDFFVYNEDDAFCRAVASRTAARAVPFSRTRALQNGAWVEDGQLVLKGQALCQTSELSLPGPHNLENALAAAAIASELSIQPAIIRHALRTFPGVEHRMETVRDLHGVRWINDSKGTNPVSSIRAVEGMSIPTVLIAGGDDKGNDFSQFAQAIANNEMIQDVILIGKTADQIEAALRAAGYRSITKNGFDFQAAIETAFSKARKGGAVLLSPACASFDMFQDYEHRGRQFKALVMALS